MFNKSLSVIKNSLIGYNKKPFFKKTTKLFKEVEVFVNNKPIKVDSSYSIFQACHEAGEIIPRFCFHEKLSVAGSCRMCLVEVEKSPKPIASCAMTVMAGMRINTKSDKTRIARGGVMEFLLANHPLDCPICDQGGECDLQDISQEYGYDGGRFKEYKRGVEDKDVGPLVKTTMTRCIHCTRCIRFNEEVAGMFSLGTTGRGKATEIGTYVENLVTSELSGNIVDLCPVGALTNKPYAFKARPWELKTVPSVDILDTILPSISVDSRGIELMRVLPRINEDVNEEWIGDKTRHALDGNKRQRLTVPLVRNLKGEMEDKDWDVAFAAIQKAVNNISGDNIQALIGEHSDLESICSLRDMMHRLDSDNISLGRNSLHIDNTVRGNFLMNSKIRGIEDTDLLLLIGTNPRYESPVLNARIRKAVNKNGLEVGLIGSPYDLSYEYNHIGSSTKSLIDIIEGKHPFCSKIAKSKNPMILVGSSMFKDKEGYEMYKSVLRLAKTGGFISEDKKWNGLNILHKDIGAINALELGIEPYMENKKGKVVILLGYDNIQENDIDKDAFVIYIGSHGDKGAERADVILPGATFYEKSATFISTEGRVENTRVCVQPPYLARDDWEIVRAISEVVGATLPYDELFEVRNRLAELIPYTLKTGVIEPYSYSKSKLNKILSENIQLSNRILPDTHDVSNLFNNYVIINNYELELLHD